MQQILVLQLSRMGTPQTTGITASDLRATEGYDKVRPVGNSLDQHQRFHYCFCGAACMIKLHTQLLKNTVKPETLGCQLPCRRPPTHNTLRPWEGALDPHPSSIFWFSLNPHATPKPQVFSSNEKKMVWQLSSALQQNEAAALILKDRGWMSSRRTLSSDAIWISENEANANWRDLFGFLKRQERKLHPHFSTTKLISVVLWGTQRKHAEAVLFLSINMFLWVLPRSQLKQRLKDSIQT